MNIQTGLFDHMVMQRDRLNRSRQRFTGACASTGVLRATVRSKDKVLAGFNSVKVGSAARGRFQGTLAGVPAGGPYDIELRVGDEVHGVKDVLVGDVWLLGGQSNMEGIGLLKNAAKPHAMVRAFYMDDHWAVARDPIHNLSLAVDEAHAIINGGKRPVRSPLVGVGPGVSFGQEMMRLTGVPQGLISCAHGGTSMTQWDPKQKRLGGKSLYGAMLRRFEKNGGKVAGIVWYQGCSDATPDASPRYFRRMKRLVRAMRRDMRSTKLPIAVVQISRVYGRPSGAEHWNSIQESQRRLPEAIPHCAVVPAIDLPMDDRIHISGTGQQTLGRRLAQAMGALKGVRKAGLPPIALKRVYLAKRSRESQVDVVVEFSNVAGRLQSAGRPSGFSMGSGMPEDFIYEIHLAGRRVVLRSGVTRQQMAQMKLSYGAGLVPYCNITDDAGRSLPVFGPVCFQPARALTPFVTTVEQSQIRPGAKKLHGLGYGSPSRSKFQRKTFPASFMDIHGNPEWSLKTDHLVVFRARIHCDEAMSLSALIGYDGPVKLWIDGREKFHDPNGTNPAEMDRRAIPFKAGRGKHEIMIALSSNNGRAWGVFLRFQRHDVSQRLLKERAGYAMPAVNV